MIPSAAGERQMLPRQTKSNRIFFFFPCVGFISSIEVYSSITSTMDAKISDFGRSPKKNMSKLMQEWV
jgi:hypothetical protein